MFDVWNKNMQPNPLVIVSFGIGCVVVALVRKTIRRRLRLVSCAEKDGGSSARFFKYAGSKLPANSLPPALIMPESVCASPPAPVQSMPLDGFPLSASAAMNESSPECVDPAGMNIKIEEMEDILGEEHPTDLLNARVRCVAPDGGEPDATKHSANDALPMDLKLDPCFSDKDRRLLSPSTPYEDKSCIPLAATPPTATWSKNHRLCVDGRAVTLVVFGAIKSILWHCEKDKPLVLKVSIELLTEPDKRALRMLAGLGNASGMTPDVLDATLPPQTPSTIFASVYDSRQGVRAKGLQEGVGLNSITGGEIIRMDVGCRRLALGEGHDHSRYIAQTSRRPNKVCSALLGVAPLAKFQQPVVTCTH
ncbi:hypothetical protein LXA43DRAFT_1063079 [Ganoderma leucocontextum]|nr:hypothetical protein LXA43DRAFT_1063079 [Ganoderma leucocontextum]